MALQGDLSSFALADVLRLLAGTGKTGALEVSSTSGSGEVWMRAGSVIGGAVPGAPHATRAADVVLELLRFDGGSFDFDDTIDVTEDGGTSVEETLDEAESMLVEWQEVEKVVPSMAAWTTLAPELDGEEVIVSADDWRILATIAGGVSVSGLAAMQSLTDLAASRQVKGLVEQGVVAIAVEEQDDPATEAFDAAPAAVEPEPEAEPLAEAAEEFEDVEAAIPDGEAFDEPMADAVSVDETNTAEASEADLAMLRSDDRPVVLEASVDALLPEPLPDEGEAFDDFEFDADAADVDRAPAMAGTGGEPEADNDDERGSLLRFLSTTKP